MNTEKMIPIDFSRNITPFVPGDVYYNNFVDAEFAMDQRDADIFNNADPRGEFNTYFIVSFADRPNTTGKQPVDSEVIVDTKWSDDDVITDKAGNLGWFITKLNIVTWKPNHESILAKFKEQGANTMFTFENTKEATEYGMAGDMLTFYKSSRWYCMNSFYQYEWVKISGQASAPEFIELSRPVGERKEDHTIDGVTTYALTYRLDHLTKEATHYNVNNSCFFIHTTGKFAQVMSISNSRWRTSTSTTNTDLNSDEFWKLDGNQVIEPWVADQLDDLINPVSEGCQAGDVISVPYSELPPCNGEIPRPVFTQEMADNNEMPPIGSECMVYGTPYIGDTDWYLTPVYGHKDGKVIGESLETGGSVDLFDKFKPIDNRSDEDKAMDDMWDSYQSDEKLGDGYPPVVIDILNDIKAGKIHGVKWIIE